MHFRWETHGYGTVALKGNQVGNNKMHTNREPKRKQLKLITFRNYSVKLKIYSNACLHVDRRNERKTDGERKHRLQSAKNDFPLSRVIFNRSLLRTY